MKTLKFILIVLCLWQFPCLLLAQNCNNWGYFKGADPGVQIGDLDIADNKITVEALFNRDVTYDPTFYGGDIVSKHQDPTDANYLLRPTRAEITTTTGYHSTPDVCNFKLNKTYYVAMVYDGKKLKFYRNGFLMSETPCTGNMVLNNWLTRIGSTAGTQDMNPSEFHGYINEVRIWNIARTQDELRSYMSQSLPNPSAQNGLLAYYTFDDLKNKQGNAQWDGSILNNASINRTNPECTLVIDSCEIQQTDVVASFNAPDTVCVNTPVNITNTSKNATTYYWSFCQADLNQKPTGKNLGNINSSFSLPVYADIVSQNGNYYGFVVNNYPGGLTRLDFGNSLLNNPSAVSLGNFGGTIEDNAEGIQIVNTGNHWYGIIVGGDEVNGTTPQIVKLDFGTDITNASPTATNWGNIGNMSYPHKLFIFNNNHNWYGFTANYNNNTITRFNFGSDFTNPPSGTNLGNFGLLDGPTGLNAITDNNKWYVFVTNAINDKIIRLNFGTSLLNTPTANDLGNVGGAMHECFDIYIQKYCDQVLGFVVNGNDNYNDIVRLDFNNDLTSIPSATSLGNIGQLSFPHSFSKLFRVGNDLYTIIPNAHNNTLTRIEFSGCNNSSIPGTNQANPPPVTYDSAGVYNINLSVDEGLPTQTSYCKQIVVINCDTICNLTDSFTYEYTTCDPKTISFHNASINADSIWWDFGNGQTDTAQNPVVQYADYGTYIVHLYAKTNAGCYDTATDTINVFIQKDSAIITNDTTICAGNSVQLNAINSLSYCWSPAGRLSDSSIQNPIASPAVTTVYYLNILTANNQPVIQDSITVTVIQPPVVDAGKNVSICFGDSVQLTATGANTYIWNSSPDLSDTTIANPIASPGTTTNFIVKGFNAQGCFDTDTVKVTVLSLPVISLTNDTAVCKGGSVMLNANAAGNNSYNWSPPSGLSNSNIPDPVASPADTTKYYVTVTDSNGCKSVDSVTVDVLNIPVVSTISDTSICKGDSVQLKTNSQYATYFQWTPGNGLNNPGIQNPLASPQKSTDYIVTAGNGYCSSNDSVFITVLSLPDVKASDDTTVCGNASVQLNVSGAESYTWTPSKDLSDSNIPDPIASPDKTTTYFVKGTAANSCANTDSVTIFIRPDPVFDISPKNTSVCSGDSVLLTASGGDVYTWSPEASVSNPNAARTSVFPDTTTSYKVIIKENTCNVTDSLTSTITVKKSPDITATKSNDIDCINFTATLSAMGGMNYRWTPSKYISNTHSNNPVVNPPMDTWYYVTATGDNGCKGEDSVLVKSIINPEAARFDIPSAFTPNHDGLNDCFGVKYWGPADYFDMAIYDRWGYLVYHSNTIRSCWDGTIRGIPQGSGTYVYKISISSKCSNGLIHKKGTVVLIR